MNGYLGVAGAAADQTITFGKSKTFRKATHLLLIGAKFWVTVPPEVPIITVEAVSHEHDGV